MAYTVTDTTTLLGSKSSQFILPDLISGCHYPLRLNPNSGSVSRVSEQWFLDEAHLAEHRVTKFMGLQAGGLIAACHPDADVFHLRVSSDFMNWFFNIDDLLDESDVAGARKMHECCISAFRDPVNFQTENISGKICKSYFSRFIQTASPGHIKRFIHAMILFFVAVEKQADDRIRGKIHNLESYVATRRDTSGCKTCFAFIEYTAQIDLPDVVVSHPVIMAMEEATNDYISWSNDIFSYNVEQARDDTHNMIVVVMHEQCLDLQSAVDYTARLCAGCIQRFEENRAILPSWGEEIDRQVAIYVGGLQNLIVGSLHWSFDTTRHFGKDGPAIKRDRIIKLLPKMSQL